MKKNIRILYLDNNPLDKVLIHDALVTSHSSFILTEAKDYDEFEQLFAEKQFDMVLTDLNILGFVGLQVLDRIKALKPDLPVIIVTGTGSEKVAVEAMKKGVNDYVLKTSRHIRRLPQTILSVFEKIENAKKLRQTENDLKESEENFRALVNNTFDAIFINDEAGNYLYVNQRAIDISEYSKEELLKMNASDLASTELKEEIGHRIKNRFKGDKSINIFESRLINKRGLEISIEIASASTTWHGLPAEVASIRDISIRKKAEKELLDALEKAHESDRLKSTFLATMSHELRTPLNAIIGFSSLIGRDLAMDQILEYAHIVNTSGTHLLSLVEDLFDLSLIEAGQIKIERKETLLWDLLNEVNEMVLAEQNKIGKQNLEIFLNIPKDDKTRTVFADASKLKQILLNLLKNALKFTSEGKIEYGYLLEGSPDNTLLKFFVKDTGIGVSKENKETIFELFRQVEDAYTREYRGAGIGLSVAKKLTTLLGGSIWVDSEKDKGAAFYFTVPVSHNKSTKAVSKELLEQNPATTVETVLIVEDDDTSFYLLKLLLRKLNVNIIRTLSGLEAINICKTNYSINMVLMDISLQDIDGYEATKEIKKNRPRLLVIAQTAHAVVGDREKALNAGCDDYLSKPISKDLFYSIMEKYGLVVKSKT